jgi:hypothetical protein
MPPRWVSAAIVALWLATTGWLFWRDLWPEWRPGEPPPFHIDLVEEVHKGNDSPLKTTWSVFRRRRADDVPHKVFNATTWVYYHREDDSFSLSAHLQTRQVRDLQPYEVARLFTVESVDSEYRVNRDGRLQSLKADVTVTTERPSSDRPSSDRAGLLGLLLKLATQPGASSSGRNGLALKLGVRLSGEVRDGQFFARCQGVLDPVKPDAQQEQPDVPPKKPDVQMDLPPVDVPPNGALLMPLHPVNRIHGLRPGQSWRQPLVDPFRDAFAALPGFSGGVRHVNARVLPQPQVLDLGDGSGVSCLVIEYEAEGETVGRTWVERDGERVQQQEAYLDGDHWIMRRDAPPKGSGRAL